MTVKLQDGAWLRRVAVLILTACLAVSAATADDDDERWKFTWDTGFKLDSPDGDFKLKFGGRLQADWTWADGDDGIEAAVGDVVTGNEFRRARLYFSGTIYSRILFKVQYDFAPGTTDFKDAYIGFKDTGAGTIWIGHFKEPFSLEELTSSKYITFLERSLNNVFAPGRNTGIIFMGDVDERFTWQAGAFRDSIDIGSASAQDKVHVSSRLTGLPHHGDKDSLVHLGLSLSYQAGGDLPFRWRQRPEDHQQPRFVDTGFFDAADAQLYALEVAGVFKRFWFSSELNLTQHSNAVAVADGSGSVLTNCSFGCAEGDALGDPGFTAGYVQVGFFLTDDRRPYNASNGTFSSVKPNRPFGKGGSGAWEIAARYSQLSLESEGIAGGEIWNASLGANWYLNKAVRMMFDLIHSDRTDIPEGTARFAQVRLQLVF